MISIRTTFSELVCAFSLLTGLSCSNSISTVEFLNGQFFSELNLQSVIAVTPTRVRLTFAEELYIPSAVEVEAYKINESNTGTTIEVFGVSQPDSGDDSIIELVVAELTEDLEYDLNIRNLFSASGNNLPKSGLDVSFLGPAPFAATTELELVTPSSANSGQTVEILVTAINTENDETVFNFNLPLTVTTTGTGELDVLHIDDWDAGESRIYLQYTTNANEGESEEVRFNVTTEGNAFESLSDDVRMDQPFTLAGFEVTVDPVVAVGEPFDVTIRALNIASNTYTDLNAPDDEVLITSSTSTGVFSAPNPASGFDDGVLVTQAVYNAGVVGMTITVRWVGNPTISGVSNSIQVQTPVQASLANFQQMAVPLSNDTIRLNWAKIPETFKVEIRKPPSATVVADLSGSTEIWYDTSLAAGSSHDYEVTALDSSLDIIFQEDVSATTFSAGCATTVGAGNISVLTTWDVASSPYCVTGAVTVDSGARLTWERGIQVVMDPAASITFTAGAELFTEDTGTGLTVVTSSDTNSSVVNHGGIVLDATAGPTVYDAATDNYLSGSILRHIYYEFGGRFEANVDFKVDDVFFRNNESGAMLFDNSTKNVLSNSTFQNNENTGNGGAVSAVSNIDVYFCIFEYNSSDASAGALVTATVGSSVTDTLFLGNVALGNGGAMTMHESGSAIRNTYIKNFASQNGGAQFEGQTSYSYFYKNEALLNGGGWYHNSNVNFNSRHNYYEENKATTGGGVFQSSNGGISYYKASHYDSYINNTSTSDASALYINSNNDHTKAIQGYFFQNYTGGTGSQVWLSNGSGGNSDEMRVIESVLEKHPLDVATDANVAFNNHTGFIDDSYFESGAADCVTGLISGARNSCDTITDNTFKTDTAWLFCVDTDPGADTPTNCIGPSWSKPSL